MLERVRRSLLLAASVTLILVLGVLAALGQLRTADDVEAAQQGNRLHLQTTLGGLTGQYLQFTLRDSQRAAEDVPWQLSAGSAADVASLRHLVLTSPLTSYGATLATLTGEPLSSWARGPLPARTDPGFLPLVASLRAGKGGVSNVMAAGDNSVVAFAVPVLREGKPAALLVALADIHEWRLQGYDRGLQLGDTAEPYVLDAAGTVAASSREDLVGRPLTDLPAVVRGGGSGLVKAEYRGVRKVISYAPSDNGWTAVTVQDEDAFSGAVRAASRRNALGMIVLLTLVVLLLVWFHHKRQEALRRLADDRLYDPLTGLAQRRLFEIRMTAALARHHRTGLPLAVLYGDLDAFKTVNDTYGHNVGDQLLAGVARRMQEATRDDDFVVRLGGDEFAVVLEATGAAEADEIRRRLHQAIEQPLTVGTHELQPRMSIGGAVLSEAGDDAELLQAADLSMYQGKQQGHDADIEVLDGRRPPAGSGSGVVPPRPASEPSTRP